MKKEIKDYNNALSPAYKTIANFLANEIAAALPDAENKIWHAHPVWFLDGNPVAGYDKLKDSLRLMFWSGAGFNEENLKPGTGKFKDASAHYTSIEQVNLKDLKRWLKKAREIQWDYKNLIKRKGKLERLK